MGNAKEKAKHQKVVHCVVKSAKMDKSRVGISRYLMKDPMFGKYMWHKTRIMFHDEKNTSREGDEVLVAPVKPMSRHKSYELVEIVKKSRG